MLTHLKLVATQPYRENGEGMVWLNFKNSPMCDSSKRYAILAHEGLFYIQEVIDVKE